MTKIEWHTPGEKRFEAGVDRGVFYSKNEDRTGYPWHGLTDIVVAPEGASLEPVYVDGIVRAFDVSPGRFKATLECFEYPEEFGVEVLGEDLVGTHPGLMATNQEIGNFDLSYRTGVGDDINGSLSAYKIHLVYDAIALPSEKQYTTVSDSTEPMTNSFDVEAVPQILAGKLPTAHFIIDTRALPQQIISEIETILYGDDFNNARMINVDEVQAIVEQEPPIRESNLAYNPSFEAAGPEVTIAENYILTPFGEDPALGLTASGFYFHAGPTQTGVSSVLLGSIDVDNVLFPNHLHKLWTSIANPVTFPTTVAYEFTRDSAGVSLLDTTTHSVGYYWESNQALGESYFKIELYNGGVFHSTLTLSCLPNVPNQWRREIINFTVPLTGMRAKITHVVQTANMSAGCVIRGTGATYRNKHNRYPFFGGSVSMIPGTTSNYVGVVDDSVSVLTGVSVAEVYPLGTEHVACLQSTEYVSDREFSALVLPLHPTPNLTGVSLISTQNANSIVRGNTYKISVDVTYDREWEHSATNRGLFFTLGGGLILRHPVQNLPGVTQRLTVAGTVQMTGSYGVYVYNGEAAGGANLFIDRLIIQEITPEELEAIPTAIQYFDGASVINPWEYGEWTGPADASPSVLRAFSN